MSKKTCKKKIVMLLLCSWVIFTSNSAIAMPPKWCMDCASFTANIAKIVDTIYKFFGSSGGNNQRQQEEVQQEEIIIETIEENRTTTRRPNGTTTQSNQCKYCTFIYLKRS